MKSMRKSRQPLINREKRKLTIAATQRKGGEVGEEER